MNLVLVYKYVVLEGFEDEERETEVCLGPCVRLSCAWKVVKKGRKEGRRFAMEVVKMKMKEGKEGRFAMEVVKMKEGEEGRKEEENEGDLVWRL